MAKKPKKNLISRDSKIVSMLKGGATLVETAKHFGLSHERVRKIALDRGYRSARHYSKPRIEVKCATCGTVIKRAPSSVSKYGSGTNYCSKRCMGIAFSKKGHCAAMLDRRKNGASWKDIANEFGLSSAASALNTARSHATRHNLEWPVKVKDRDGGDGED